MNTEFLCDLLLWSTVVNYAILMAWFSLFVFTRDFVRKVHGRWFNLSDQAFDVIHYSGMAAYKILIFVFNLAPLIALCIVRSAF